MYAVCLGKIRIILLRPALPGRENPLRVCLLSPGHLGILAHAQQDGLCVNEETPAGESEQQQNEGASLHDDADP